MDQLADAGLSFQRGMNGGNNRIRWAWQKKQEVVGRNDRELIFDYWNLTSLYFTIN
jgi:hypothetical protein